MYSMYTADKLNKFPYFRELLKDRDLSGILDSLTGLVSRPYMLDMIHYLIRNEIPFTLALLDLDNFKFINDTYGHKVGDGVLAGVAEDMIRYLDDYGIAGRIGGDEFMMVNFRDLDYDSAKKFYLEMYANFNVMRKNIDLETCSPFITGTLGSATFPKDAKDYDTLFSLVDKTLYRGKTKGRNCYIIYVEAKHKDIVIKDLKGHGLYVTFHNLAEQFDSTENIYGKMDAMFSVLKESLRISDLYFTGKNRIMRSITTGEELADVSDIDELMKEDLYQSNSLTKISEICPKLYRFLRDKEIETVMIVRISASHNTFGYLMCAEPHTLRIWQQDDCATLFSVGRMLAGYIQGRNIDF